MITLSADFLEHVAAKDTRKLTVAHLYYDESNYLPIATVATVIGGVQHYGILKDMSGYSQKWNVEAKNNVTTNTPKLTIINYNTPDGFSIVSEFNTNSYYGRSIKIFYGYEGQILADMLAAFEGVIDEINFKDNNVILTASNQAFPTIDLMGSRIDYDSQTIGDTSAPAGYKVHKDNHNKYLPIPFGNHWNAPFQPGYYSETTKETSYGLFDEDYSTLLKNNDLIKTDIYNYSIGQQTSSILIFNEDFYTPLHQQDWYESTDSTYTSRYNDATYLNGISVGGVDTTFHRRTDDKFFVTVPLRYYVRTDIDPWFYADWFAGSGSTDTDTTIAKVFDNSDYTTPFNINTDSSAGFEMWVKLTLDSKKNLCGDEQSYIRQNRKIAVPSTESNHGGQGYLPSKYKINVGTIGYFPGSGLWQTVPAFPVTINHWKEGFIPDDVQADWDDPRFIAAGIGMTRDLLPRETKEEF